MKFTLAQTSAKSSSRRRARGFAAVFALAVLPCANVARAQEAATPVAPQPPSATATPRPARPGAQRAPVAPAARTARPAIVAAPPASPQASTQTPTPAIAAVPPRQVVTVVHRLSGWKLLAWLATSGPPALELDEDRARLAFRISMFERIGDELMRKHRKRGRLVAGYFDFFRFADD